uniref:PH domain-containing protein n=1 Tax=Pelusios castaneus TaxID=367368 RepID=A0A8C8R6Q2_9SAUR
PQNGRARGRAARRAGGMRLNDGHVAYLGLLAKRDGSRRGYLSKRSGDNPRWHSKWFALLQNMLFCFESDASARPSGLYLLEGSACERAPSPKPCLSAKDSLEKQVGARPCAMGVQRCARALVSVPPRGTSCLAEARSGGGCPAPSAEPGLAAGLWGIGG